MNEKEPKTIEELAYAIKFDYGKYTKTKLSRFKSDLAALLLEKLNFKEYAKKDLNAKIELSQNGYNTKNVYDGEIFAMSFKSSMEKYGMKDLKTGRLIPFIQMFRSHYNVKKPQININKFNEENDKVETKIKNETIKIFLQQQAKKWGNKKLPKDFKTWNISQCTEFLKSLGADKENEDRAIKKLNDLFTNRYMKRIAPIESDNNDNKTETVIDIVNEEEKFRNTAIEQVSDILDTALSDINDKSLKQYAQYYITMKIILKYKIRGFNNLIIDEYVDKDLEEFYYKKYSNYAEEKYVKDIVADYLHKKPDTVRKKLDKVKKLIQNSSLRKISKDEINVR